MGGGSIISTRDVYQAIRSLVIRSICTYVRTCMHTHVHFTTHGKYVHQSVVSQLCALIQFPLHRAVPVYIHTYVCTSTYVCMCIRMSVCLYVGTYICMYTHTYVLNVYTVQLA